MTSRRTAKLAQAVLEQVSSTILFGLKDPRVKNVTVTRAEVTADLRNAKVYVSVMGDEKTQKLCMQGLNSARGFLQAKLGDRLQTRYTPVLKFILDSGVKHSFEVSKRLREVLADSTTSTDLEERTGKACLSEDSNPSEQELKEIPPLHEEDLREEPLHLRSSEKKV